MTQWKILLIGLVVSIAILQGRTQTAPYFSKVINFNDAQNESFGMAYDGEEFVYLNSPYLCENNGNPVSCGAILKLDTTGEIIWIDTVPNRLLEGWWAFFWKDSLLYHGKRLFGGEQDSLVVLSAMNADKEIVWQRSYDIPNEPRQGTSSFIPFKNGVFHTSQVSNDSLTSYHRVFDHELELTSEWQTSNQFNREFALNLGGTIGLTDGTFIGSDVACSVVRRCGQLARFDSLGNVSWRFRLDQSGDFTESYLPDMAPLPEGDFVASWYSAYEGADPDDAWAGRMTFYRINTAGEVEWTLQFTDDYDQRKFVINIYPLSNGDVLGAGIYLNHVPEFTTVPATFLSCGYMCRISPEGELLWERTICDSVLSVPFSRYMYLNHAVELANGDLMLGGNLHVPSSANPETRKTDAIWLVRTDSLGCLQPGCGEEQIITSTNEINTPLTTPTVRARIWPNPTRGQAQIQLENRKLSSQYQLLLHDVHGRQMKQHELGGVESLRLSTEEWPAGIYYWQLYEDGRWVQSGKLNKL